MDATKVEVQVQEEDEKPLRSPMKPFAHPLRFHRLTPRRSSSMSLISLEGAISGLAFPSSSELSFGDDIDEDYGMEQDSKAIVDLPTMEEPVLPALPEEVEVPLPEVLRAPVLHSPIWAPVLSPRPLETAVVPGLVGSEVEIPPPVKGEEEVVLDEGDQDEFLLDGAQDILLIHPGGNGDIEFDGDNLLVSSYNGVLPEEDGALKLDGDLVGHVDGDVYMVDGDNDNNDDDDDGRNDDVRYVEKIPHHVYIAPPPNPEPEEMEEGFVFGAASWGVGSSSNTRPTESAEDAIPSPRQMTGTFGPNQLDYRLGEPSIVTSWAQESVVEINVPVPGRASVSNISWIQNENQMGSRESGSLARGWLNSLAGHEAFSNLTTREIRNGARNAQSSLERDA
jgi:hypothetical protein